MKLCLPVVGLLMASASAFADDLTFTSPGSNIWWPAWAYVSPYQAHNNTNGVDLSIYCDDYNHDIAPPFHWFANVTALAAGNLASFQFGGITQAYSFALSGGLSTFSPVTISTNAARYDMYLEAAYLFSQSNAAAGNPLAQQEFQAAAWTLFIDSAHVNTLNNAINANAAFAQAVMADLGAAQANAGAFNTTDWYVVTATPAFVANSNNGQLVQEFLTYSPQTTKLLSPSPEPAAIVLLATVILLLGLLFRKRLRGETI